MRALDQARNVGDGEAVVIDRHGAELGLERGERVIGDLGARARHRREKSRLTGIGQADQAGVRQQLEPQPQPAPSPGAPGVDWRGARLVADLKWLLPRPPSPPRARTIVCSRPHQVGDRGLPVRVENLGADGQGEFDVGAARPVRSLPMPCSPRAALKCWR